MWSIVCDLFDEYFGDEADGQKHTKLYNAIVFFKCITVDGGVIYSRVAYGVYGQIDCQTLLGHIFTNKVEECWKNGINLKGLVVIKAEEFEEARRAPSED